MILNEIQTNRPWDRYGSYPTPSPHPYYTHRGNFADSDFHEAKCFTLKKCYPLTSVM